MKRVLALAAVSEAALGLVLLVYPTIVVRLLLGAEIAGAGITVSRVAGIALLSLGVACWPGSETGSGSSRPLLAMLCYSLLVTLYLAFLGITGGQVGSLLWPAVAVHAVLTFLLGRKWLKDQHEDAE
jgi:hypothetical protein